MDWKAELKGFDGLPLQEGKPRPPGELDNEAWIAKGRVDNLIAAPLAAALRDLARRDDAHAQLLMFFVRQQLPLAMPLTLGTAAINGLVGLSADKISGEEQLRRYMLAQRVDGARNGTPGEFTAEDISKIKDCLAAHYSGNPLVTGQAFQMLEAGRAGGGKPEKAKK